MRKSPFRRVRGGCTGRLSVRWRCGRGCGIYVKRNLTRTFHMQSVLKLLCCAVCLVPPCVPRTSKNRPCRSPFHVYLGAKPFGKPRNVAAYFLNCEWFSPDLVATRRLFTQWRDICSILTLQIAFQPAKLLHTVYLRKSKNNQLSLFTRSS